MGEEGSNAVQAHPSEITLEETETHFFLLSKYDLRNRARLWPTSSTRIRNRLRIGQAMIRNRPLIGREWTRNPPRIGQDKIRNCLEQKTERAIENRPTPSYEYLCSLVIQGGPSALMYTQSFHVLILEQCFGPRDAEQLARTGSKCGIVGVQQAV